MKPYAPADELAMSPRRIGRYRVLGRLGAGGMGVVYLGIDSADRKVAIKVIRPELASDRAFRVRFEREVEAAERVQGAYTARVIEPDANASHPYLVTQFISGPTLDQFIDNEGPLRGHALRAFALALAEALGAIHRIGLVHRDLKPTNILIAPNGPRVIDFGIARAADATSVTLTGTTLGTPAWMAPEQARGDTAGPAADVFAWGALVAYAGTGRHPFGTGTADALLYRVVHQDPDLMGLEADITSIVASALSKDPSARATAADLVGGLLGDNSITQVDDSATARIIDLVGTTWHGSVASTSEPSVFKRMHRTLRRASLLMLVVLAAGAIWLASNDITGPGKGAIPTSDQGDNETTQLEYGSGHDPSVVFRADPPPVARDKAIRSLLRPHTFKTHVIYGEMDGRAPEEIVVGSSRDPDNPFSQRYVDVFSWRPAGWRRVFDGGTAIDPQSAPLLPRGGSSGLSGTEVSFLDLVDFEKDGSEEVVVAIRYFGAGNGPMELHVLSLEGLRMQSAYMETTKNGGAVSQVGSAIELSTGSYRPGDPLCCPSFEITKVIGARSGSIGVLRTSVNHTLGDARPSRSGAVNNARSGLSLG